MLSIATSISAQMSAKVSYLPLELDEIGVNPQKQYTQPKEQNSWKNPIQIYPDITFQSISGIGGCFNEIGGEALSCLSDKKQKEVLNALFNMETGSAMSFCRASVGSSDFGIDAYSFSEVADDYQMEHFSLEREKEYMLPFIQKALEVNPDIRLFTSPWSPPAWMKYSGYMDRGIEFPDKNMLIDDPRIYNAYALYFLKYIEGYRAEGVNVERLLIQNEQDIHTKYPSCRMPVEQMSEFVATYLRPLFTKEDVDTQIWAGTFRTAGELEGLRFAASSRFQRGFDGIGIQYTQPGYMNEIVTLAPNLKMMHTEGNCFNGENSVEQARTRFEEVASYLNAGCENYAYWNFVINETGLSGWDWKQNCLITIDRDSKEVIYNPDYAVISFMSRYIKPNSVRVAAFCRETLISLAHADGYTLIMQNDTDKSRCYNCIVGDEEVVFEIPAFSLCAVEIE
ncbi:MAG: hypothetical protein R3Y39_01925 [Rikenellaceae bacterium]